MRLSRRAFLAAAVSAVGGCGSGARAVVPYTSVDQVFAEPVFRSFEGRSKTAVRGVFDTEEAKSTGVVARLVAEQERPRADVFWSGDPVRPFQLIRRGMVEPYASPAAEGLPAKAPEGMWTGFAARARVLLVHKRVKEVPKSIRDLASPAFRGQAAMASPLFGTTTMHVGSLFVTWGEERTRKFLDEVRANETKIASSNGEVKRLVAAGEASFGLTDTDDAHEAMQSGADVTVVFPDQDDLGTLFMPTSVVLIKGGPHGEAARRLVDFLLSAEVERMLVERGAHLPMRKGIDPPSTLPQATTAKRMEADFAKVAEAIEQQEAWLRSWARL